MKSSQQVERELRERILRQVYPPGSQLREQGLAKEMGAKRNAVRVALKALEARKLVERVANRGATVARLDADRLLEIYDVFELLEGLTARLAAENSQPEDWASLVELFGPAMEKDIDQGNFDAYFAAVEQYRATASRLAGNVFLSEVLSSIYDQTSTIIRRILIIPGRAHQSIEEHRRVLEALTRGDAEAAEQLKRENMRSGRQALQKYRHFLL